MIKQTGKVNYLVDMHDHRKKRQVFHVNMLKEFKIHMAPIVPTTLSI